MNEINNENNNASACLIAGSALGEPKPVGDGEHLEYAVIPQGFTVKEFDLEKYRERPGRKRGKVELATAASFIAWVSRNKTPETVIYAKESNTSFLAIFNGHEANLQPAADATTSGTMGSAGWGDFTSFYGCPLSDEWKRWHGASQHDKDAERKAAMKHAEFIQFIEDNLLDITSPPSGQMLSAVRAFEAKRDVKFASAKRLDNGDVSFAYAEDTQQQIPPGALSLPSQFSITIPVFKSGTAYVIDANLRYRVTAGGLFLWYELVRPHKSLEHAFNSVSDQIHDGTDVPMFST